MTEDEKRLLMLVGRIQLAELVAEHTGFAVHPRVRDTHRRELEAVLAILDPTRVPPPAAQEDGA